MKLESLTELYILQANYHQEKSESSSHPFPTKYNELMQQYSITTEDVMAPSQFDKQPNIPFVLFKPEIPDGEKRPLIIHTHGGPHVYMDKNKPHAEVLYYVSHGYVVACPNYRGSSNYPDIGDDKEGWQQWTKSKENLHIYGPEDVYTVTLFMQNKPYIDSSKTILRGGSFGSFINSHLLADVGKGKFKNIFIGAHLSGGVKYPNAFDMPLNFPLLISHSIKDNIAPYSDARLFMEKSLLRALSMEITGEPCRSVQTFVAKQGDHHLIDPEISQHSNKSDSVTELSDYLKLSTNFINTLFTSGTFTPDEPYDQFKNVMDGSASTTDDLSNEILSRAQAINYVKSLALPEAPEKYTIPESYEEKLAFCPTLAHLRLQLGNAFTGNIESDLTTFFSKHFSPINWTAFREELSDAGKRILEDKAFFNQMVEIVQKEKEFLEQHQDYMVIYHAAQNNVLQLYTFINMWKNLLTDQSPRHLPALTELRLFDFVKASLEDISTFLIKMRKRKHLSEIFNNIPGFADRAAACNPGLTFNSHNTASSSLWWHFDGNTNERVDVDKVIGNLFRLLGIYSPERVAIYKHFFEKESQNLGANGKKQSVMQQLFVPYVIAEKYSYLCQMWGEEFESNPIKLDRPERIRDLCRDPVTFEKLLREHITAFTNPGNCPKFGKTEKGFLYSGSLQLRYLPQSDTAITVNTFLRNDSIQQDFIAKLLNLMLLDFSDHLACGYIVSDAIVPGAQAIKLKHQKRIGFFKQPIGISDEELFIQQSQLIQGLEKEPTKQWYRAITTVDKTRKAALQKRLRETIVKKASVNILTDLPTQRDTTLDNARGTPTLYSLCIYLQGYTYFDLLKEIAEVRLEETLKIVAEHEKQLIKENHDEIMKKIDIFSSPASMDNQYIGSSGFAILRHSLESFLSYQYDPDKHEILQDKPAYEETYLMRLEIGVAIECVLRFARICKDTHYGYDTSSRRMEIY